MSERKVVRVDFRRGRKPAAGGFGGSRRLLLGVFLAALVSELLLVAAFYPAAIGSSFFGPTAIALAVLVTLGARRAIARWQVARLQSQLLRGGGARDHGEVREDRTLH